MSTASSSTAHASSPTSTLSLRRALIPFGYRVEYLLTAPLAPLQLPLIVQDFLSLLPDSPLTDGLIIRDYKGRDRMNFIEGGEGRPVPPSADELFYLGGRVTNAPDQKGHPCFYTVTTEFDSFDNPHHILYRVAAKRSENLPMVDETSDLGRLVGLVPERLRIGIDHFRSRFISRWFGFAPTVFETLLIEADPAQFRLKIYAEEIRRKEALPLQRNDLFQQIERLLQRHLHFDLRADYLAKVQA